MLDGAGDRLRIAGALATFVVGAVHLQQYADFIKDVPTIGVLFLLNAFGAGVVCLLLGTRARLLGAVAGVAVSATALVSIAISRYIAGGLFDYVEPTLRGPVLISVLAEVIAVVSLTSYLAGARSAARRDALTEPGAVRSTPS